MKLLLLKLLELRKDIIFLHIHFNKDIQMVETIKLVIISILIIDAHLSK